MNGSPGKSLVGHRGCPARFPENTLPGMRAAIDAGARFVETDIQLCADGVPLLFHDADLQRLCGTAGEVMDKTAAELTGLEVRDLARPQERVSGMRIPTLREFCGLLREREEVCAFIEIKTESTERFGIASVMDAVLSELGGLERRCVLISFSREVLHYARAHALLPIGWILTKWGSEEWEEAASLGVDYLFCDVEELPPEEERRGEWIWAVYCVDDPARALRLFEEGVGLVESDDVIGMLRSLPPGRPAREREL
ncbi:MAG: glycerophosphodiester phosphodiesterase [Planctomycetes bacterium]|nr:glycerophosphodiester phosphodiesterase [Planctomycetota bacterium]